MDEANTISMDVEIGNQGKENEFHLLEVNYSYQVSEVETNEESPLTLQLNKKFSESNMLIQVWISNKLDYDIGFTSCVIALPSGYSIRVSDLENKVLLGQISYYELRRHNSELILHFEEIKEKETKSVIIDLLKKYEVKNQNLASAIAFINYAKEESIVFTKF